MKYKRELQTGRKPSATTSELSLGKNQQLRRIAIRLNVGGYNHINLRLRARWNRRSTHGLHENLEGANNMGTALSEPLT